MERKIHPDKTKIMKEKTKIAEKTSVRSSALKEVEHFEYLGSYISADSNMEKETSIRTGSSARALRGLKHIWNSTVLQT